MLDTFNLAGPAGYTFLSNKKNHYLGVTPCLFNSDGAGTAEWDNLNPDVRTAELFQPQKT